MEKITGINASRVEWCLADFGLTKEDLAGQTRISEATLNKVLAGEGGLTFNQLKRLADFFGRGLLFFLDSGDVNPEQVHSTQFRTLSNQKPELSPSVRKFIERVERHRDIYLALAEDSENDEIGEFSPPALDRTKPKEAASIVREWLKISGENSFDQFRAAVEAKGILVFRTNGYIGKWEMGSEVPVLGFSLYHESCPIIVVRKRRFESSQSFTLMHELGHLLLHRNSAIDDYQDLYSYQGAESEANAFAGSLLVPLNQLSEINLSDMPESVEKFSDWLSPYSRRLGVGTEVLLRRLSDENLISTKIYQEFRAWLSDQDFSKKDGGVRMYRHREPKHIFGDRFVRAVLDSLHEKRIPLTKASKYLDGLSATDIHKLDRYYAGA